MPMLDEIHNSFAARIPFSRLNDAHDAIVLYHHDFYGVFLDMNYPADTQRVREEMHGISMDVGYPMEIQGETRRGILFYCRPEIYTPYFAQLCTFFLLPLNRDTLYQDPWEWWNELKNMTGNTIRTQNPDFVFAEFIVFLYLKGLNGGITWKSCRNYHDLEAADGSQIEVKSTVCHHLSLISISSQFQLDAAENVPFDLYFCRLAENREDGVSFENLVGIAQNMGCNMHEIEHILNTQHLDAYSPQWRMKFYPCEICKYNVQDGRFPKIRMDSFNENINVNALHSVTAEINLAALTDLREDVTNAVKERLGLRN